MPEKNLVATIARHELRKERYGTTDEIYLGDGLYATFDGYQIVLRAPREDSDHWVALEPAVFKALVDFAGYINEKYKVQHFKWQM